MAGLDRPHVLMGKMLFFKGKMTFDQTRRVNQTSPHSGFSLTTILVDVRCALPRLRMRMQHRIYVYHAALITSITPLPRDVRGTTFSFFLFFL
jgi:hypothetical protein